MRTSLSVPLVRGLSVGLLAFVWLVASAARRSPDHDAWRFANFCAQADETTIEYAIDQAKSIASDPDSGSLEMRAEYGLIAWPEDSVSATTDSIVCHHIDSLIGVWHASPDGIASGVRRNATWGPLLVMVRLNPGRYYVWPGIMNDEGWAYNFIVDSVGGGVEYYETPF
jgi:hypothetical protein